MTSWSNFLRPGCIRVFSIFGRFDPQSAVTLGRTCPGVSGPAVPSVGRVSNYVWRVISIELILWTSILAGKNYPLAAVVPPPNQRAASTCESNEKTTDKDCSTSRRYCAGNALRLFRAPAHADFFAVHTIGQPYGRGASRLGWWDASRLWRGIDDGADTGLLWHYGFYWRHHFGFSLQPHCRVDRGPGV